MKANVTEAKITKSVERAGFSVSEVAEMYAVSKGFLRLEMERGRLKRTRLGRRVVITREALDRWLAQGEAN